MIKKIFILGATFPFWCCSQCWCPALKKQSRLSRISKTAFLKFNWLKKRFSYLGEFSQRKFLLPFSYSLKLWFSDTNRPLYFHLTLQIYIVLSVCLSQFRKNWLLSHPVPNENENVQHILWRRAYIEYCSHKRHRSENEFFPAQPLHWNPFNLCAFS